MGTTQSFDDEWQQRFDTHGRMTKVVAFELPITDSAIQHLLETETDMTTGFQPLPMTSVEAPIAETIQQELGDTPFALYS